MANQGPKSQTILVVGGGIAGITAAVEAAGYVGCQTVRPFANTDGGGKYDTYDDPEFLDNFKRAVAPRRWTMTRRPRAAAAPISSA